MRVQAPIALSRRRTIDKLIPSPQKNDPERAL
jgi:hypothetical protein